MEAHLPASHSSGRIGIVETSWPTGPRLVSRLWAFITLTALGAIVSAIAAGDPGGVAYAVVISISAAGRSLPSGP